MTEAGRLVVGSPVHRVKAAMNGLQLADGRYFG